MNATISLSNRIVNKFQTQFANEIKDGSKISEKQALEFSKVVGNLIVAEKDGFFKSVDSAQAGLADFKANTKQALLGSLNAEQEAKHKETIKFIMKHAEAKAELNIADFKNNNIGDNILALGFKPEATFRERREGQKSLEKLYSSLDRINLRQLGKDQSNMMTIPQQKKMIIDCLKKANGNTEKFLQYVEREQQNGKFVLKETISVLKTELEDYAKNFSTVGELQGNGILVDSLSGSCQALGVKSVADKMDLKGVPTVEKQVIDNDGKKVTAKLPDSDQVKKMAKVAAANPQSVEKVEKFIEQFNEALTKEVVAVNEANAKLGLKSDYQQYGDLLADSRTKDKAQKRLNEIIKEHGDKANKELSKEEQCYLRDKAVMVKSASLEKKNYGALSKIIAADLVPNSILSIIFAGALSLLGGPFGLPLIISFIGTNIMSLTDASSKAEMDEPKIKPEQPKKQETATV